ncbi:TrmH family RNA methyltransferase [Streptomyces antarcticus]|uniref:TrmH family RNA methyltransferase n=1 Tax=Streptomyces antarcticus TaxID=2996458 RepID=UPI0022712350|nr:MULTISPECIES: RNA methyltransferase [unclassified Streptomyces]MCY0945429.1 RNA methyltransferase [Streptomyces sp. H34-AA3]MCY0953924.1 RNA methyltransferase [Streptomyces sp. H27-S2]MCZ4084950.1 RNA methyltransferase [Streptomyces sp. H34-S5]
MSEDAGADETVRLWREAVGRGDLVLLDGFHALKHALRFGARVEAVVADDPAAVRALARELAPDVGADVARLVRRAELKGLLARVHPTGVAALAVRPDREAGRAALGRLPRPAPVVVLDNPRNLGNVGAVVRLAAGFGATGVVTRGDLDPWHPNVVRAGAGLHYATTVDRVELEELPPGPLYALDPEGEDIRSLTLPDDAVLAFGSERHGISPELRARADHLVSLPMRPQVSSYNLATSVAMALFHWGGPKA